MISESIWNMYYLASISAIETSTRCSIVDLSSAYHHRFHDNAGKKQKSSVVAAAPLSSR